MAAALIHAEFGDDCDLYAVLCVERSATTKEINRAYRKLALKFHPDKQRGDDVSCAKATAKFQALSAIHSILNNKEARAVYDESGTILADDHDDKSPSSQMWTQYFARIFPKVTKEDITKFQEEYRFSDEERRDVLAAYIKYEGEMKHVMDTIMLSTDDDEGRFAEMIQKAIEIKEVKAFPAWCEYMKKQRPAFSSNQKRESSKRKEEAREAEALFNKIRGKQQKRGESLDSTACSIERKRGFETLLGNLEAKYADKRKEFKRKAVPCNEPSEEDFLAAQSRLIVASKRKRKK